MSEAQAAKLEGMARVEENTDPEWRKKAEAAFQVVRTSLDEFTTDDVWELLTAWGVAKPHEARAMGPVVTAQIREELIVNTLERPRKSRLPQGHQRLVQVYKRR